VGILESKKGGSNRTLAAKFSTKMKHNITRGHINGFIQCLPQTFPDGSQPIVWSMGWKDYSICTEQTPEVGAEGCPASVPESPVTNVGSTIESPHA